MRIINKREDEIYHIVWPLFGVISESKERSIRFLTEEFQLCGILEWANLILFVELKMGNQIRLLYKVTFTDTGRQLF